MDPSSVRLTRRDFVRATAAATAGVLTSPHRTPAADQPKPSRKRRVGEPFLTPAADFQDVSRGNPKPFTLTGDALIRARLTPETWRLEIARDAFTDAVVKEPAQLARELTMAAGTALDLPALRELGQSCGVKFIKAMQCLNIAEPLGQGLWEGVPLREVLRLCAPMRNVRRIYYWGFHNDDPKQLFQSSLSYTQAMETPPGELPAFLAYGLNGEPIPLLRGGPVRMIVPWAHGFKSIKWLQRIGLTNDFRANDTYANGNNDPESHLKTAAYLSGLPDRYPAAEPVTIGGLVISGLSGLERVEYLLRTIDPAAPDDPEPGDAKWSRCELAGPPDWKTVLPQGVASREVLGFDPRTGEPRSWPLRYSMITWSAPLGRLAAGHYAFHVRAVDGNGFAQPEPRPILKAGRNGVEMHRFEVS
jgi:DMSO/TMAO reductase YedYZ molybdopterin-dependent catalytic subunit